MSSDLRTDLRVLPSGEAALAASRTCQLRCACRVVDQPLCPPERLHRTVTIQVAVGALDLSNARATHIRDAERYLHIVQRLTVVGVEPEILSTKALAAT